MDINKINPWLAGITLIFAGSLLLYFEGYRNNDIISTLSYLSVFGGWIFLYIRVVKGTPLEEKTDEFSKANPEPFMQHISKMFAIFLLLGIVVGNIYYVSRLGNARKIDILQNQPSQTTIAEVTGIQVRRSRRSTSYYAIFEYTAGNKTIRHPWYEENEGDFLVGQRFEIRYSIKYPEMVEIIGTAR